MTGKRRSNQQLPQLLWKADQHVLVLAFGDVPAERPRRSLERLLREREVRHPGLPREATDELVAPQLDGCPAGIPALVVEAANQHGKLSSQLDRLVDAEPVTQHVQHSSKHMVGL